MIFQYDTELLKTFPNLSGGIILARGLRNGPTPAPLADAFLAEQQAVLARIGQTPLSQIEPLEAWRAAFRQFGVDPTKYRSAPESLLRRLTKKGDIPSINCLVDLGNLVSIRHALPVAAFDTRALHGAVTVHFATGHERYTPLGESQVEHPEPGEVVFSDETGLVIARRWCWRQAEQSAAQPDTTSAIIALEAQHADGAAAVEAGLQELLDMLRRYTGGQLTVGVLGAGRAMISDEGAA